MFDPEEAQEKLGLGDLPDDFIPKNNIAPGSNVPVVINPVDRNVLMFRWGLIPGWAKDEKIGYRMFNARAETVADKPSFRVPFRKQRCLIPSDGFYEWKMVNDRKYPFLFTLKNKSPFTFAGLWEQWRDGEGNIIKSCTLITTTPNSLVAEYHDRMPVILADENRWKWLEDRPQNELQAMLAPIDPGVMATPQQIDRL